MGLGRPWPSCAFAHKSSRVTLDRPAGSALFSRKEPAAPHSNAPAESLQPWRPTPRETRQYPPDQGLLLPPSLRDGLPEDPRAFFFSDAVDALHLRAFDTRYGRDGPGEQAFDPRMRGKGLISERLGRREASTEIKRSRSYFQGRAG